MELVAHNASHADLRQIIASGVKAVEAELWHLEFNKIPEGFEFIVYIDAEPLTADTCADVARHLMAVLGAEGYEADKLFIDVSSPGLNRGLYSIEQCQKYIGRNIRCDFSQAGFLLGKLASTTGDKISLELQHGAIIDLNFSDIGQINLQEN